MRTTQTPSIQPLDLLRYVGRELSARTAKSAMRAAERLEKQLRQAWGLPAVSIFCVWDKRRFAVVLPPVLPPQYAGWTEVPNWQRWYRPHDYLYQAQIQRENTQITITRRYIKVGYTYVLCCVITDIKTV